MKKVFDKIYIFIIMIFLYAPILVMLVFSFNESKSRNVFTGFTLKWYENLFNNELVIKSFLLSLIVAIIASVVATFLGTFSAIGFYNMKNKNMSIFLNISYIPIINPDIITGISLMILFVSFRSFFSFFNLSFYTILISHITFCTPYVILNVLPKLRQLDKSQYEAALDLGCSEKQALFKVIFPQIMPGIVSGFLMSFAFSIDDFIISYFTSGPDSQTLPVTINSMIRRIVTPEIYALSTLMFIITLLMLFIYNIVDTKKYKKKRR